MPTEIERRYVVFKMDPFTFTSTPRLIEQGYYPTSDPDKVLRVRIIDGTDVEIVKKSGSGQVREEEELAFSSRWSTEVIHGFRLDVARFLLADAPWRLTKRRYRRDGWEIDRYNPPFKGLYIAERESSEVTTGDILPPWIIKAVEVTDRLNNFELAQIANMTPERAPMMAVFRQVFNDGPVPDDIMAIMNE